MFCIFAQFFNEIDDIFFDFDIQKKIKVTFQTFQNCLQIFTKNPSKQHSIRSEIDIKLLIFQYIELSDMDVQKIPMQKNGGAKRES